MTPKATVERLCSAAILLLHRRFDRKSLAEMGLTGPRSAVLGLLFGVAVVLTGAVIVVAPVTLLGWAQWTEFNAVAFLGFLASNTLVALLLEAIPEEIAIRGYALTSLRQGFNPLAASALGILTFLLVPMIALSAGWILGQASGGGEFAAAPGGQDALMYYTMLAAFGLMLTFARDATVVATVWTCIGAHLAWLTVNRIVLGGATGVRVDIAPGVEIVISFR